MIVTPHGMSGPLIFEVIDKLSHGRRWLGVVLYWCVTLPLAFVSHFLLDMVPHYDYSLTSPSLSKGITRLLIDSLLCWCILIGFTNKKSLAIDVREEKMFFAGIVAISPDVIVNLGKIFNIGFLSRFIAFHDWMHSTIHPGLPIGLGIQAMVVLLFFWWLSLFHKTKVEEVFIPERVA